MKTSERAPEESKKRFREWTMVVLALAVVPAIILEDRAVDARLRLAGVVANWTIWILFAAEYCNRWRSAAYASPFLRRTWPELALLALTPPIGVPESWQALRSLRLIRALRVLRAVSVAAVGLRSLRYLLGRRGLHWTLAVGAIVVLLGALGAYVFELRADGTIRSFPDALWWAIVTATTVGYGDLSPVTLEGRVIAVLLMVAGIGIIGVFTANVASLFFEHDAHHEQQALEQRLRVIEAKLDTILRHIAVQQTEPSHPVQQPVSLDDHGDPGCQKTA